MLGDDEVSSGIARRLSKRTGLVLYVSYSVPELGPLIQPSVEQRMLEALQPYSLK